MVKVFLSDLPVEVQAEVCEILGKDFTKKFKKGDKDAIFSIEPNESSIVDLISDKGVA